MKKLDDIFRQYAPRYKSVSYRNFDETFAWDQDVCEFIKTLSPRRANKRINAYVIPGEIERSRGSLRFGNTKTGRGYQSERGDFCLLAGVVDGSRLTLFYRSLELVAGLHYDLCVVEQVRKRFKVKSVRVIACKAFVFGVKGRKSFTKERTFNAIKKYYEGRR